MLRNSTESRNALFSKILIFFISPIISFIYSLSDFRTKSSYKIFFLFSVCYGLCITYTADIASFDGSVHAEDFIYTSQMAFSDYWYRITHIWGSESLLMDKDIYALTLKFIVSRFTDNYHILFCVEAAIFALLSLSAFKYFTTSEKVRPSLVYFVLAYFFFSCSIFVITGLRWCIAYWLSVLSIFKIWLDGKRWPVIILLLLPLVHISFVFLYPVLIIYYLLRSKETMWIVLFVISFVATEIGNLLVESLIDYMPQILAKMATAYLHYDEIMGVGESTIFSNINDIINRIYVNSLFVICIINRKQFYNNECHHKLFLFALVLATMSNFVYMVPSLGIRFQGIAVTISAYLIANQTLSKNQITWLKLFPILCVLKIYYEIKLNYRLFEPCFFWGNPFVYIYNYIINPDNSGLDATRHLFDIN